jgi:hypothetical protein
MAPQQSFAASAIFGRESCYRICYRPELRGLAQSWPKGPESDSRKERLPETSEGVQRFG